VLSHLTFQRNLSNRLPMQAQKTFRDSFFDHLEPKPLEYLNITRFLDGRHLHDRKPHIDSKHRKVTKQGASDTAPPMRRGDCNALNVKRQGTNDALGDAHHRIGAIQGDNPCAG